MRNKGALIVFAKPPIPGLVKTRLIPGLGRRRATTLYQDVLTKTLNKARLAGFSTIQVWVHGNVRHFYFNRLRNRHSVKLYEQKGKDLGQKMSHAIRFALRRHAYAVLIGSDCPGLLISDLQSASEHLENNTDAVLGPAEDGGYYLIGMRKNSDQVFRNMKWSKDTVFSETCSRLKTLGFKSQFLSKRADLDRTSDLSAFLRLKRKESVLYF